MRVHETSIGACQFDRPCRLELIFFFVDVLNLLFPAAKTPILVARKLFLEDVAIGKANIGSRYSSRLRGCSERAVA